LSFSAKAAGMKQKRKPKMRLELRMGDEVKNQM
jgi:hypothetical protein